MTGTAVPAASTPAPAPGAPESPPPLRTGYRPHLDGIRTLAVYLVLTFHAGITRFEGGYIGVDVFFVLSGYLVTQLLVRDLRSRGSIDLLRFYARRFRRLLPAAFAVLLITAAVYAAIASPAEVLDAFDAIRASFLYSANWFFLGHSTDYFGADINASPVLHYWSLAVEEQFYLTWPLLLFGLYAVGRRFGPRRWTVVRIGVAAGALVSLALAFRYAATDVNRAYFGTDARAYQLLAGALLALTPAFFAFRPRARLVLQRIAPVAFLAIVVLASSAVGLGPVGRGFAATVATFVLLVALENAEGGVARRVLSLSPIVYLGRISYGTYLWQWPVILVATKSFELGSRSTLLISALVATGLASLSYQLLEQPIRASKFLDRFKVQVVAVSLAVTVVAALVVLPAVLDTDAGSARVVVAEGTGAGVGATAVPADLDWRGAQRDRPDFPDCTDGPVSGCTLTHGHGPTMLVVGDSHARMLLPAFEAFAKRHSIELSAAVFPVCPWQQDLFFDEGMEDCRAHKQDWYDRLIPELDPDIVVLAERSVDDPVDAVDLQGPEGKLTAKTPDLQRVVRTTSAATVDRLRAEGRTVVIVEPVPVAPKDVEPIACLSQADFLDQCRYVANARATPVEQTFRSLAAPGVFTLDIDSWVCPYLPICDPVVGGLIVKRDVGHLTGAFSRSLADDLNTYLAYTGIVSK